MSASILDLYEGSALPEDAFAASPVGWMQRELQRVEGLPAEFIIPFMLGAISGAVGRGIEVESFRGKFSRANLYIVLKAESGTGKSEVGKRVFKPLYTADEHNREMFSRNARPRIEAKMRVLDAKIKKEESSSMVTDTDNLEQTLTGLFAEKAGLERAMAPPRLLVEDCTQEALERVLGQQNGELTLISTDGRTVVKNILGRYRNGAAEEDVFIKAWSGDTYSVDRIGREPIAPIHDPCLSMFLAIQPDLFYRLVSQPEFLESGFFARLLPASMEEYAPSISPLHLQLSSEVVDKYEKHVHSILTCYHNASTPFRVAQSEESRDVLDEFYNEAMRLVELDPSLAPCYRRWAEMACRLALCVQVAIFGREAHKLPLHGYCAMRGVYMTRWFGAQQRDLLSSTLKQGEQELRQSLFDLVHTNHPEGISVRDAWKKLKRNSVTVRRLVDQHDKLIIEKVPPPFCIGRPSEMIRLITATPGF